MDNTKRKVEELMTAINRIVDSRESKADLFGFDEERESLKENWEFPHIIHSKYTISFMEIFNHFYLTFFQRMLQ